jgi:integrase
MVIQARQQKAIVEARKGAADYVPHVSQDEVIRLIQAAEGAARTPRQGRRDGLLIATMFDGCLRVSEALQFTPSSLKHIATGWLGSFTGKGGKFGEVALSPSLVAQLQRYAYEGEVKPNERIFPFSRQQAHHIVKRAFDLTGIIKPDGVGFDHILRHSGAIARLAATGNPKALQDQLRHQSAKMTLRYLKTLSAKESLVIQQGVDFGW